MRHTKVCLALLILIAFCADSLAAEIRKAAMRQAEPESLCFEKACALATAKETQRFGGRRPVSRGNSFEFAMPHSSSTRSPIRELNQPG
jgi:hypothetical protein